MRRDSSPGSPGRDEQFHDFVVERRGRLLHTARLLTAGDAHLAEDLVQTVLTKLYVSWGAFRRASNPDGYLRRVLVNAFLNERRRAWWRFERLIATPPDHAHTPSMSEPVNPQLMSALRELPPRMRAAVVFRYVYDLDVAETAGILGCSTGTVKSQTSRALDKLRTALETAPQPMEMHR